jgi:uncharacterized membrane protein HdeD (DUF308 family)
MLTLLTKKLSRDSWHFAVRGVLTIVFGIVALIWPGVTQLALVLLFGAFVLTDGSFTIATAISTRKYFKRWWALLLEGVTGIVIAAITFLWPNITGLALMYFIAGWAILTGIFEIAAAIEFRNLIPGEWATLLMGLLSTILGILMFVYPGAGAVGIVWAIGFYAIFFGIMELVFANRLRGLGREFNSKQTSNAHA